MNTYEFIPVTWAAPGTINNEPTDVPSYHKLADDTSAAMQAWSMIRLRQAAAVAVCQYDPDSNDQPRFVGIFQNDVEPAPTCEWEHPYTDFDGSRASADCVSISAVAVHTGEGDVWHACLSHAPEVRAEVAHFQCNMSWANSNLGVTRDDGFLRAIEELIDPNKALDLAGFGAIVVPMHKAFKLYGVAGVDYEPAVCDNCGKDVHAPEELRECMDSMLAPPRNEEAELAEYERRISPPLVQYPLPY